MAIDLAALLRRTKLTAGTLARYAGVHRNTLSAWVNDPPSHLSAEALQRLADGLAQHGKEVGDAVRELRAEAKRCRAAAKKRGGGTP